MQYAKIWTRLIKNAIFSNGESWYTEHVKHRKGSTGWIKVCDDTMKCLYCNGLFSHGDSSSHSCDWVKNGSELPVYEHNQRRSV